MGNILGFGVIGSIIFFTILFYIIRTAVEDGVLYALKKYDREKERQRLIEDDEDEEEF
ncbi:MULTISPECIES: hypothetical protein [Clostridium]|uniref:hypothetical protein n=1 Tax=Clostridium TaxID=1485 RepID=UPI00144136C3|nr:MULTISPECIES: hypothetical protein [Clostridium]MBS5939341.1 hypothetical protein [Clostridium sp.]